MKLGDGLLSGSAERDDDVHSIDDDAIAVLGEYRSEHRKEKRFDCSCGKVEGIDDSLWRAEDEQQPKQQGLAGEQQPKRSGTRSEAGAERFREGCIHEER